MAEEYLVTRDEFMWGVTDTEGWVSGSFGGEQSGAEHRRVPGRSVAYPGESSTLRLIFDTETSFLLSEELTSQTPGGPITEWRAYSEPVVVDSDSARP